jgi:hypothetical protein
VSPPPGPAVDLPRALAAPELVDFVEEDLDNVSTLLGIFNEARTAVRARSTSPAHELEVRVEDAVRFSYRLVR